jgi:uncharacterized protein (DUF1501 family)
MKSTRREFLQQAAVFSALGFAPQFLARAAHPAVNAIQGFKDDRVLVVVQLGGGNDGLNTLVPFGDDAYYRARPKLGIVKDQLHKLDDHLGLNPKLEGFMRLYDSGKLGIVQGVGYPNPDRSHFRSMEIWHTASNSDEYLGHGWIGRYFDNQCDGEARPQAGMAVGPERPQAFEGAKGFGIATENPRRFGWETGDLFADEHLFETVNAPQTGANDTLDFLRHTAMNALNGSRQVRAAADRGKVAGQVQQARRNLSQLDTVAGLIRGGLETRIYYVSTSGFDTHANQANQHDALMATVGESLAKFQAQLEADGTADRVTTMVFSEFGRRVRENGSGGTDHGTAAPLFLIGNHIKPGLHGQTPSLIDLDDGDLKYTTDFRSVYATLLDQWFATNPAQVLGADFNRLALMA